MKYLKMTPEQESILHKSYMDIGRNASIIKYKNIFNCTYKDMGQFFDISATQARYIFEKDYIEKLKAWNERVVIVKDILDGKSDRYIPDKS